MSAPFLSSRRVTVTQSTQAKGFDAEDNESRPVGFLGLDLQEKSKYNVVSVSVSGEQTGTHVPDGEGAVPIRSDN